MHVHTQYSLFDGLCRIPDMVQKAKELNMPAVAITDHGNMYGVIYLYKEAVKQGVKPILGCEVYMTKGSRFEKKTKERLCHLILLAKDLKGYHNLVKIVSKGFVDGENNYHKPRVDYDLLEQYHEGLIAMSACIEGHIQQNILNRDEEGAGRRWSGWCAFSARTISIWKCRITGWRRKRSSARCLSAGRRNMD